jgi:dethiobiotin synthetase
MTTVLITGTDTDVGKTWLGRALGHALAAAGRRVVAIKPVETGCADATALQEDGALLAAATGQAEPLAALYRFAEPVAPVLAAEAAGESLDLDAMLLRLEALSAEAEVVLLEGAAGLLEPMTWEWTVVDLARALGATVLVVAPDRLGTINHTLLTVGALELAGLEVAGVVLMTPASPDPSTGTNAAAIARLAGIDRIVTMPRLANPAAAAKEVEPIVGWIPVPAG